MRLEAITTLRATVLAATLMLVPATQGRPLPQAGEVIDDSEAYAVYAAMLQRRSQSDRHGARDIKLLQETRQSRTCTEVGSTPPDWQPAIESYRQANARTRLLKTGIDLGIPYSLITPSMVQSIAAVAAQDPSPRLGGGPEPGLPILPAVYLAVSAVGFNTEKTFALVYTEDECDRLDVKSGTIICNRGDVTPWDKIAGQWQPASNGTACNWIARRAWPAVEDTWAVRPSEHEPLRHASLAASSSAARSRPLM